MKNKGKFFFVGANILLLIMLVIMQIFVPGVGFGQNIWEVNASVENVKESEITQIASSLGKEDLSFLNATEEATTYAKSMAVIEADSGRLLYQKNSNQKLAMASTTKIMTALVVIKNCKNLDERFKVDDRAVGIEGTSLYLHKSEEKNVRELLYGLMLPSGNDAAIALACKIAGSEKEFCEMMNEEAKKIGANNTHFANAHGLDVDEHYTTAYDLALITAEGMKNEVFREIVSTKNVRVSGNEEVAGKALKNKNKLLWSLEGCNGVKTGFTNSAGRCFVSSVERGGMTIICCVLNCGPMFEEAERLTNLAFENYKKYDLLKSYEPNKILNVKDGLKNSVQTYTMKHFSFPLTIEEYGKIEYDLKLPEVVQAPVEKEQEIGKIEIKLNNHLLFTEKIYTMDGVESTRFFDKVEKVIDYWNI